MASVFSISFCFFFPFFRIPVQVRICFVCIHWFLASQQWFPTTTLPPLLHCHCLLAVSMAFSSAFHERLHQMDCTRIQRLSLLQVQFDSPPHFHYFPLQFPHNHAKIWIFISYNAGREGVASRQVPSFGFEARKHQGLRTEVLLARSQNRVSEFQASRSQMSNREPRSQARFTFTATQVATCVFKTWNRWLIGLVLGRCRTRWRSSRNCATRERDFTRPRG